MKDQMDVCPLARRVMLRVGSTPIHPITGWRSLLPSSYARTLVGLPYGSPSPEREAYGVAMFRLSNNEWGRRALSTGSVAAHDKERENPCARYSALLAQAFQHLWLVFFDDVYQAFTWVRHTIHPRPVSVSVLTDTSAPRGCDASLMTVGSLSEGSVRVVAFPHIFVGYR
jgi:hypothetical protein